MAVPEPNDFAGGLLQERLRTSLIHVDPLRYDAFRLPERTLAKWPALVSAVPVESWALPMERSPIRSSEKKASKRTFAYWSSFAIASDARA